ncbi:MAG TPA: histidine--tRNA ligase [bacterium]|nr:histidine--tRNA ligase [bacterium]
MKPLYSGVRGTRDLIGTEAKRLLALERSLGDWCELFGYQPIITPVFEEEGLFTRSLGDATDVVSKEIYSFSDKKGRKLALRPEGTAGVCRALVQQPGFAQRPAGRYYYAGPMFRYDRPQAGRYRQFFQFGVECFGEPGPFADAEQVVMIDRWLRRAGLAAYEVRVNSIGCPACRGNFVAALQERWRGHADALCGDCRDRIERNPLRVLDCKVRDCWSQRGEVPAAEGLLCDCCRDHFRRFRGLLDSVGLCYRQDDRLVRGLDYYTRTTFEFVSTALGAQSAFLGGGRYDGLLAQLGGPATPAIGWAVGLDRLLTLLPPAWSPAAETTAAPIPALPPVAQTRGCWYLALGSDAAAAACFPLVLELRRRGIDVRWSGKPDKLGKQLKQANAAGAACVLIMHDDEVQRQCVQLKDFVGKTEPKTFALTADAAALAEQLMTYLDSLPPADRS